MGSFFGRPYRFNGMKIRLGTALNIQIFKYEELAASEKDKTMISSKVKKHPGDKKTKPVAVIFMKSSLHET